MHMQAVMKFLLRPGCVSLQATVAVMQDGTIAIEANLSHALVQWPFLSDISLVWAAASIFQPDASTGDDPADKAAAQAVAETLDKSTQQPWLYLNIVLRNSQLFLPVLDLVGPAKTPPWQDQDCISIAPCTVLHKVGITILRAAHCFSPCATCSHTPDSAHLVRGSKEDTALQCKQLREDVCKPNTSQCYVDLDYVDQ